MNLSSNRLGRVEVLASAKAVLPRASTLSLQRNFDQSRWRKSSKQALRRDQTMRNLESCRELLVETGTAGAVLREASLRYQLWLARADLEKAHAGGP
jgi:hypothetical protein